MLVPQSQARRLGVIERNVAGAPRRTRWIRWPGRPVAALLARIAVGGWMPAAPGEQNGQQDDADDHEKSEQAGKVGTGELRRSGHT